MNDQPAPALHPEEDRLLVIWRLAEGRLALIVKIAQPAAWTLAAGEAWRAQIAYREAVADRLRREEAADRGRRKRPVRGRRAGRGSARVGGL